MTIVTGRSTVPHSQQLGGHLSKQGSQRAPHNQEARLEGALPQGKLFIRQVRNSQEAGAVDPVIASIKLMLRKLKTCKAVRHQHL